MRDLVSVNSPPHECHGRKWSVVFVFVFVYVRVCLFVVCTHIHMSKFSIVTKHYDHAT